MKKLLAILALIISSAVAIAQVYSGLGRGIVGTAQYAYSTSTLIANGISYIDTYDHGREMQTAYQINGQGEGYNPTEAGSAADGTGPTSTTQVINVTESVPNNYWVKTVHPAFWQPHNGQTVSPDTLISVHYMLGENIIGTSYYLSFAQQYSSVAVEGQTVHLVSQFTQLYTYDPSTKTLTAIPYTPGQTYTYSLPVIFATPDSNNALGYYSPAHGGTYIAIPNPQQSSIYKLDCNWFSLTNPAVNTNYTWQCYAPFGTLQQVVASIDFLYANYPPQ